jgi:transposase InsO family protein
MWCAEILYIWMEQSIRLRGREKDIGDYLMGYYNQYRPHSFNGGIAPLWQRKS